MVPANRAGELAETVKQAVESEWQRIAGAVWSACENAGLTNDEDGIISDKRKTRFDTQIACFLSLSWQATPWPDTLEAALKLADGVGPEMPIRQARERVEAVLRMATHQMPKEHRDGRYYVGGKDGPKDKLNNIGLGWSVILAFNSWALDAVRQTRHFTAANAGGWETGTFSNKDVLTGRDEAVAGGRVWAERSQTLGGQWKFLFKHDDWLGAATLVKRLWHFAYLAKSPWSLETGSKRFPMPNTRSLAAHVPFGHDDDPQSNEAQETDSSEKYFAVLALDGDEIGKWVSGEKAPPITGQLADYTDGSDVQRFGAKPYFERPEFKGFLSTQRPLSPSYHLQFSEALSNFALLCARPIVEAFDGRLIYAGGDDVVALLPADMALACAEALRLAFRGCPTLKTFLENHTRRLHEQHECEQKRSSPDAPCYQKLASEGRLMDSPVPGFIVLFDYVDQQKRAIPFMVPGPAADCSVGIAIAHFKAPLQDVVRAAQTAEKRAKRQLGRSAVAVTLCKRSGETIEWGCKWDSGGLDIYDAIMEAMAARAVSGKFPHRVVQLLDSYVTTSSPLAPTSLEPLKDFPAVDVALREFRHALDRQGLDKKSDSFGKLADLARGQSEPDAVLSQYLTQVKQDAEGKLTKAREDGNKWSRLAPADKRSLEIGPVEAPIQAIIGLCQTVAFAHRTRTENSPKS